MADVKINEQSPSGQNASRRALDPTLSSMIPVNKDKIKKHNKSESIKYLYNDDVDEIFQYNGILIETNGNVKSISWNDHQAPKLLSDGKSVYIFKRYHNEFYDYRLTVYYCQSAKTINDAKQPTYDRNRYSDLFDYTYYGNLLVVDEYKIITPEMIKDLWKYRIF